VRLQAILDAGHVPNLLLHGPAGCGKTTIVSILTAKIAEHPNVVLINVL
jgi:replication-associated recombination protein RarA